MNRYEFDKVRLQKYMPQLRIAAFLSADALGKKVGLSKQAISVIEKNDKPITKLQYIGIRAAFEDEIEKKPQNIDFRDMYDLVFSEPDFYKKNKEQVEKAIGLIERDIKIYKTELKEKIKKIQKKHSLVKTASNALMVGGLVGVTASATVAAVGGIAAMLFPAVYATSERNRKNLMNAMDKFETLFLEMAEEKERELMAGKIPEKVREQLDLRDDNPNRRSSYINEKRWLKEAFLA